MEELEVCCHEGARISKADSDNLPMKETPFKELILYIIGDRSDAASGMEDM